MKAMNSEIKKVFDRVKDVQGQLQTLVNGQDWIEEARKYAKRQGKEVKKLFGPDVQKMKKFLETERKALLRFQKQIPGEVKKLNKYLTHQRKEFEKLLTQVSKMTVAKKSARKKASVSTKTKKSASPSKKRASAGASSSEMSASG